MPVNDADLAALIDARKAAERVVADMQEGPLKETAFEVVLSRLISPGPTAQALAAPRRGKWRKTAANGEPAKTPRRSSKRGAVAWLRSLIEEGFFDEPRALPDIVEHLRRTKAVNYKQPAISGKIVTLVREGLLTREREGRDGKSVYAYRRVVQ